MLSNINFREIFREIFNIGEIFFPLHHHVVELYPLKIIHQIEICYFHNTGLVSGIISSAHSENEGDYF